MEQRKNNLFMPLLLNALKAKKNWFFLSTVIIFITTFLIPYILGMKGDFFILFGVFETFALVFVNCLVDSSFFHNDSKLAYYKSKPLSFREQVSINIIINMVFTGFLLVLIALSVIFQGWNYEIFEAFKVFVPWLLTGIFLAALSSILAGNTLVAGAMTLFNFALPGIIYLIIQFMFSILENMVAGFSARVLMDYFVNNFYKLDYIYFAVYSDKSVDCIYFLLLGIILVGITLLIFKMLKRRKNENTGNFMAFDGYKYFVSVLASLIIPAFFSITGYTGSIANEIIVSLLMAALTYYIIIAAMEKSFRISRLSVKVFAVSMAVFVAVTGGTVVFANQYKNVVPDADDVKMAYIGNNTWGYSSTKRYIENKDEIDNSDISEIQNKYNIILFTDKENIETITEIHKEILSDQSYDNDDFYMNDIMIIYYMNDGSYIIRDYNTENNSDANNQAKDEIASKLLSSQEFKKRKYYYLYNEEYYSNNNYIINVRLQHDARDTNTTAYADINLDEIREYLVKDIDKVYSNVKGSFSALSNYEYGMPYKEYKEMGYYLDINVRDNNDNSKDYTYTIQLDEGFENTKEYLNLK
jgi:DNA-binding cell septation regulator SpoVG